MKFDAGGMCVVALCLVSNVCGETKTIEYQVYAVSDLCTKWHI